MKRRIALFCTLIATTLAASEDQLPHDRFKTDYPQFITFFGKPRFKLPNQTNTDLKATFTIAEAGAYTLVDDIASMAGANRVIYITTSNVILDLGGNSITLIAGSGPLITGIAIAPNISNVIIRNGIISSMNGNGIFVDAGCTNIRIENVTIAQCVTSGVSFAGIASGIITGCSMKKCRIQQCNGGANDTYGLKLSYCNFFTIKNCSLVAQLASTASKNAYAVYAINCKNGLFFECDAQGTIATLVAAGFYVDTGCSCFSFKNCNAKWTNSSAATNVGKAYGFYQIGSLSNVFEQCTSTNNSAFALAVGFYTQNSSYSSFTQCSSYNNFITGTAGTNGGYGFLSDTATCEGNLFDHCYAAGNKGSADVNSRGCGFSLDNSLGCTIQYCISQANDGVSGSGIGIAIRSGAARCAISYNSIIANTSSTLAKGYGIWDEGIAATTTTVLYSNFAFGNRDETITPTNQNYVTTYSQANVVQTVAKTAVQNLNTNPYQNIGITP